MPHFKLFASVLFNTAEFYVVLKTEMLKFSWCLVKNGFLAKYNQERETTHSKIHSKLFDHFYIFSFLFKAKLHISKGEINMIKV